MKAVYKFKHDFGRYGKLKGIFVADDSEIENLIGKEIYFGEVLGKHSEVIVEIIPESIVCMEWADQDFVNKFEKLHLSCGYDPRRYMWRMPGGGPEDWVEV